MRLKGRTALVTGGGTGIGLGIAVALAAEGCRVAIAGRRVEVLEKVVKSYNGPTPLLAHPVDVSDRQSVERLFQWAAQQLGPIDILVNSAGTNIVHRSLADTTFEEWSMLLDVNLTGTFYCLQAVLPQMRSRGDGLVINVSSIAGKRALRLGGVGYCASKFGMTALGTFASLEEGKNGIRVTNIYPGEVDTPILDAPSGAAERGAPQPHLAAGRRRRRGGDDRLPAAAGSCGGDRDQADDAGVCVGGRLQATGYRTKNEKRRLRGAEHAKPPAGQSSVLGRYVLWPVAYPGQRVNNQFWPAAGCLFGPFEQHLVADGRKPLGDFLDERFPPSGCLNRAVRILAVR